MCRIYVTFSTMAGVAPLRVAVVVLVSRLASAAFRECGTGQLQSSAQVPATAPHMVQASQLSGNASAVAEAAEQAPANATGTEQAEGTLEAEDRIAVYMYNIGSAEPLSREPHLIPDVPADMDAYYMVEAESWTPVIDHTGLLDEWRAKGWQILPLSKAEGSVAISQNRLTSKLAKFTPPAQISEGHSWVVTFDATVYLDLHSVRAFLDNHAGAPLVLLDWRHWTGDYNATGYQCLVDEMEAMMGDAPHELITTNSSLKNCRRWLRSMEIMRSHVSCDNDLFPHYYDLSIMFRNLRHPYTQMVDRVFQGIAEVSQYMERDRFVMPSYLKEQDLTGEVDLVRVEDLQQSLGHCVVANTDAPSTGSSMLKQFGFNVSMMFEAGNTTLSQDFGSNASLTRTETTMVTLLRRAGGSTSASEGQPHTMMTTRLKRTPVTAVLKKMLPANSDRI